MSGRTRRLPGHARPRSATALRAVAAVMAGAVEANREAHLAGILGRDLTAALKKAAKEEGSTARGLTEQIVREWLTAHGYLGAEPAAAQAPPAPPRTRPGRKG